MPNNGYKYTFNMFMEGIGDIPFQSANIICTPNGVEASINLHANESLLELKPKTAIQIFFKEWFGEKPAWGLLFDGFHSRYDKNEDSSGGIGVAIQARDFRMDIRKAPAAMACMQMDNIEGATYYNTATLFKKITYKVNGKPFNPKDRTFGNSGLDDLYSIMQKIAASAVGNPNLTKKSEVNIPWYNEYYQGLIQAMPAPDSEKDNQGNKFDKDRADGCFFLDAFVRGIWLEATGGSVLSQFLNKRIRTDKRFLVPRNQAGFTMWSRQWLAQIGGEAVMADSQFSSIESMIMRLAGLFMVRVYSCNSPSLISLDDTIDGKKNMALPYVIDETVRQFLIKEDKDNFGAPYILNESMLLPPLEFTAPPDCNLIFPCMYNRIVWQQDYDADITRGYFHRNDFLTTQETGLEQRWAYQVPNALLYTSKDNVESSDASTADKKDKRQKVTTVPLTEEEKYKGVNIMTGTVDAELVSRQVNTIMPYILFNKEVADSIDIEIGKLRDKAESASDNTSGSAQVSDSLVRGNISPEEAQFATASYNDKMQKIGSRNKTRETKDKEALNHAANRHSIFKFLNSKYIGRVVTVDMAFNPYIMSGFPGVVIADDHGDGFKTLKTMIGMVQQVKHLITRDGEASTSIIMNSVRYINEPTDIDENGNGLFVPATDQLKAGIDENTFEYKLGNSYFVKDGRAKIKVTSFQSEKDLDERKYDLRVITGYPLNIYAKDVLAISNEDVEQGKINGLYLDEFYAPNKITAFYKHVFGQRSNFMIGTHTEKDKVTKFMYDSINEAIVNLQTNEQLKTNLNNYEDAMKYVKRNICSEEAFFCGILGLTIEKIDEKSKKVTYVKKLTNFDDTISRSRYFGISSEEWNKLDSTLKSGSLGKEDKGLMSSIRETKPMTAFIQERQELVVAYKNAVLQQVEGVSF